MSVHNGVVEVSATSTRSFEDAIRAGMLRASRTRNYQGAWVKDQRLDIADGQVTTFHVNLHVIVGRPD